MDFYRNLIKQVVFLKQYLFGWDESHELNDGGENGRQHFRLDIGGAERKTKQFGPLRMHSTKQNHLFKRVEQRIKIVLGKEMRT